MTTADSSERISKIEAKLKENPNDETLQNQLAEALVERLIEGPYEEGKEEEQSRIDKERLATLLNQLPPNTALYSRAYLSYREFNDDEAARWIEKWAMEISAQGTPLGCESCFYQLIWPFQDASASFWRAIVAGFERHWPDAAVVLYLKGEAEQSDANDDKALAYFKQSLNTDQSFWRAALGCVFIYHTAKNWEQAIDYLNQCLKNKDAQDVPAVYVVKASSLHALERYSEAEKAYRSCLELDPTWPNMRLALGRCLFVQEKYEDALTAFDKAIQDGDSGRQALWYKIKVLEKLNRSEEAASERTRIASPHPTSPRTLLFTWNPNKTPWPTLQEEIVEAKRVGFFIGDWSCGRTKNIHPGDRIFLHCQGRGPKGVIGMGTAISDVWEQAHWDTEQAQAGKKALYIDVEWDRVLDPTIEPPLSRETLITEFPQVNWDTQRSGILIKEEVVDALTKAWKAHLETLTQ